MSDLDESVLSCLVWPMLFRGDLEVVAAVVENVGYEFWSLKELVNYLSAYYLASGNTNLLRLPDELVPGRVLHDCMLRMWT